MRRCCLRLGACGAIALLALRGSEAAAQTSTPAPNAPVEEELEEPVLQEARLRCSGEIISTIEVRPFQPFVGGVLQRWQLVSRAVSALHVTTRPEVIRGFLLLEEGAPCTEQRRMESERILRAQPFLAWAVIRPEPIGRGRIRLVVETLDEVSIVTGFRGGSSPAVRMVRLGEDNLMGRAIHASGEWRAGTWGRDGFSARLMHYQLLNRPYQLMVEGRREQIGGRIMGAVTQPFYTDLQRVAWRATAGHAHDLFELRRDGADPLGLVTRRVHADAGGVLRVGPPGRLGLIGFALTHEQEVVNHTLRQFTEFGPVVIPDVIGIEETYGRTRSTRVNVLAGVRSIEFMQVMGFDALTGLQDVRRGVQIGTLIGRSMVGLSDRDEDFFLGLDVYGGFGSPTSFTSINAKGEARRDDATNEWDGMIGTARLAYYARFAPSQTLIATAEWAGGARTRIPFQLLLGQREGGVRGYADSDVGGGQRAVVRLENRWAIGQFQETGAYGVAVFADAGRTWAGDVPFGIDSPIKSGVGVGLLAAVPPGSQRLWRVDLAYPLTADRRAGFEVRISSSNLSRTGWREAPDVERSREHTMPQALFRWP